MPQESSHLVCVKTTSLKLIVSQPYDNTLLQIQYAPKQMKTDTDDNIRIIGQARSSFHLSVKRVHFLSGNRLVNNGE